MKRLFRWTLLDRFILVQLWKPFIFGFLGFVLILSVEPINTAVRNVVNQHHNPWIVLKWFIARIPQDLPLAFPMATLLASLNAFGVLSKNFEITALRSSGLSFARILLPVFYFACLSTILTLLFNEFVVPEAAERRLYYRKKVMQKNLKWRDKKGVFQKTRDGKLIYIGEVLHDKNILLHLSIYKFDDKQRIRERWNALSATQKSKNRWLLQEVTRTIIDEKGEQISVERVATMSYEMAENTDVFTRDIKKTSEMSLRRLWTWIKYYKKSGSVNTLGMETEFYSKTSVPFSCFIFAFIGACLGMGHVRSGGFVGFGVAILVIFVYYFLLSISLSMGRTALFPPVVAAWTPNLVFMMIAYYLSREERLMQT